jgi:lipopolysaccharide transport system ATP-binding protein
MRVFSGSKKLGKGLQMSSNIAIEVESISKRYEIYDQPSDRLKQFIIPQVSRLFGFKPRQYFRPYWAVKNVSFKVQKGETIGIIGRNGSGKSTLLQMICSTLHPSNGTLKTNGRIAALLELGSGFNPEFSGRENVYLNAAVLGLSKVQIDERYGDIVKFADIGEFIEQPVKTYSSGMLVRLAFAVIAHVNADILVIDEALAVGDVVFTQKCMRFLREHMQKGSLLFVSHDINSVLSLCTKALWLNEGKVEQFGDTQAVVEAYTLFTQQKIAGEEFTFVALKPEDTKTSDAAAADTVELEENTQVSYFTQIQNSTGWATGNALITGVQLLKQDNLPATLLCGGERLTIVIEAKALSTLKSPILGWFLKDKLGQSLFGEHTFTYTNPPLILEKNEIARATFQFKLPLLPNGEYSMTVSIAEGDPFHHVQHHWLHDAVILKVESTVLRYGLIGIPFEKVEMSKITNHNAH